MRFLMILQSMIVAYWTSDWVLEQFTDIDTSPDPGPIIGQVMATNVWQSLVCWQSQGTYIQELKYQTSHVLTKDYISGCAFSFKSQSVSLLHAHLLLELFSSSLLAETGGKCPIIYSVTRLVLTKQLPYQI